MLCVAFAAPKLVVAIPAISTPWPSLSRKDMNSPENDAKNRVFACFVPPCLPDFCCKIMAKVCHAAAKTKGLP
jgi:hypothetical protein